MVIKAKPHSYCSWQFRLPEVGVGVRGGEGGEEAGLLECISGAPEIRLVL